MYKKRNNHTGNQHRNGSYQKPRFHARNQGKDLNPMLFVNRAASREDTPDVIAVPFSTLALHEKLQRNIAARGFSQMTPIQEKALPHILRGEDVIGLANTGTGKTATFLIPYIHKALSDRNQRILIVTPTRELAMQILDEFTQLAVGADLDAVLCIGGADIKKQEKKLRHNPHVIIGTPGRLVDLVKRKSINLFLYQNVVLDEVDRMVDVGFIREVQFLIGFLPQKRQSLFFSATITLKEKTILQQFVTNPTTISVKQQDTSENIDQDIIRVKDASRKVDMLHDLLIQREFEKVLVFGRTKWGIEKLTKNLISRGFKAASIHGNKSQGQRQRALDEFKKNQVQVLLATDVASRGLDISDVTHVINFDVPATYEDYVHRIGRTGRADKKGKALTFVE